ncbi:hypothetical protein COU20_00970 [Candidatus Kaiserbacteria bacterium CG10_big_fil_rev_8_21_14_0_10_59_10]|uniref:Uncharacterized protein n=1 Tax=Candidatus Kaiserbacteria bacterium CG10_big_fil_rev_8_21_14_0_10_59_10 TaxID=1974612 RepID=A0A2H0U8K2_9BACT|nr:MAG: hypothetical protein COU20_00970 [Candidatus Kaiserbacteria bacterium CG10_big_fil_rev_8_21_14_0_10_59_10]
MTWASRRRALYLAVIGGVLFLIAGIPLLVWLYKPPTCFDGRQNQGETAVDKGGPCAVLDERTLIPHSVQWSRAFPVRSGSISAGAHNAVAYIENPNGEAAVMYAPYAFRLYDPNNVLVAEREGIAFIMPGSITPIFEAGIPTGGRSLTRTFFEFTAPLVWERATDMAREIAILGKQARDPSTAPRVTAIAENTSVADARNVQFVAVVFNPAGNAFAASETVLPLLAAGERRELVFTWPEAFREMVGRIDIFPVRPPQPAR